MKFRGELEELKRLVTSALPTGGKWGESFG